MSPTISPEELLVQLHARVAELEAAGAEQQDSLTRRENELKQVQGGLLLAQAQILELGDLLAARDTALKNATADTPNLQKILDTQLARTDEVNRQLLAAEDRLASGQLQLAATTERATAAERTAREAIARADQAAETARASLQSAEGELAGHRRHAASLETQLAEVRAALAQTENSAAAVVRRAETAEAALATQAAVLKKIQSHWVWRATGPFHD